MGFEIENLYELFKESIEKKTKNSYSLNFFIAPQLYSSLN